VHQLLWYLQTLMTTNQQMDGIFRYITPLVSFAALV
jgi:hypothetical protein